MTFPLNASHDLIPDLIEPRCQTLPAQIPNPTWIKVKFPIPGWPFVSNFLLQVKCPGGRCQAHINVSKTRSWVIQCSVSYHSENQILNFRHLASIILKFDVNDLEISILDLQNIELEGFTIDGHTFLFTPLVSCGMGWHPSTRQTVNFDF